MKKTFILIGLISISVVIWIAYIMYNKPHRNVAEEIAINIPANQLFSQFESDESLANQLYLDKVLEIEGKILEVTTNQQAVPVLMLETSNTMFGVRCTMKNMATEVNVGDSVKIKGICTGYLSDVVIVNGTFVK